MNADASFVPHIQVRLTSSLSSPTCSLSAILWQLTWILWESDRLGVEGNQASAPAGWGAILRAWLQRCSSARNAASQQYACCYPRTTVSLSGCAEGGYSPVSARVFIWADACHCVPATNASWHAIYILNYLSCLLSEGKKSVLSRHVFRLNGCLIHHRASQFNSVQLDRRCTLHSWRK